MQRSPNLEIMNQKTTRPQTIREKQGLTHCATRNRTIDNANKEAVQEYKDAKGMR